MKCWKWLSLQMSGGDIGVSAFPDGESIFTWIGTVEGGKGTLYEGLSYKLSLRFPLDYPFKPPQVKFETMCFHPNVDQFGNICLDILQVFIICVLVCLALPLLWMPRIYRWSFNFYCINLHQVFHPSTTFSWGYNNCPTCMFLQDKWSSAYDCRTILLSIQSLLEGLVLISFEFCIHLCLLVWSICFLITEPNLESPLNSYAAALWNDKEGLEKYILKLPTLFLLFHLFQLLYSWTKVVGFFLTLSSGDFCRVHILIGAVNMPCRLPENGSQTVFCWRSSWKLIDTIPKRDQLVSTSLLRMFAWKKLFMSAIFFFFNLLWYCNLKLRDF